MLALIIGVECTNIEQYTYSKFNVLTFDPTLVSRVPLTFKNRTATGTALSRHLFKASLFQFWNFDFDESIPVTGIVCLTPGYSYAVTRFSFKMSCNIAIQERANFSSHRMLRFPRIFSPHLGFILSIDPDRSRLLTFALLIDWRLLFWWSSKFKAMGC